MSVSRSLKNDVGFSSKTQIFRPMKFSKSIVLGYDLLEMAKTRLFVADRLCHKKWSLENFNQLCYSEKSFGPLIG